MDFWCSVVRIYREQGLRSYRLLGCEIREKESDLYRPGHVRIDLPLWFCKRNVKLCSAPIFQL